MPNPPPCELCESVAPANAKQTPRLIKEFTHSTLFVGAHQKFQGYCVLVAKHHVREPFELPIAALEELMTAARAIQKAFAPWKINYGCYGNQVPHVHWHIFPRYASDPEVKLVPWMQSAEFDRHTTTPEQAIQIARQIRAALEN